MKKILFVLTLGLLYSNNSFAVECEVQFGGGGKNSSIFKLKNNKLTKSSNLGSPWSFLRYSKGPCKFTLFNENNHKGRKIQYGETVRTRIASQDGKSKGGWKVRSLIIEPLASSCQIVLKAEQDKSIIDHIKNINGEVYTGPRHKGYFYHSGPANFNNISSLSTVYRTTGDSSCSYTLYNDNNFAGRQITVGRVNKAFRGDWRIRSMKITNKVNNSSKLIPPKSKMYIKPNKRSKPKARIK